MHAYFSVLYRTYFNKAGWPNGKALDYESRDCRFDPCVGQFFSSEKGKSRNLFSRLAGPTT
ncbi:hypothetical protein N7451_006099 [Penicillium sp. IBT 35674x]|nr:hypothetical protein N7451_006099 [Penicillium sp. IBT 35674x]